MRHIFQGVLAVVLMAVCAAQTVMANPVAVKKNKVGLVLSGGGAKGIAHIGVLQALEDNHIPVDYITGTSMGAIVGSLYAAGYSPREMLGLLASPGFADWSTGTINPDRINYVLTDPDSPSFINVNLGKGASSSVKTVLPMSLINPIPMNMAFLEIYSRYTAQCGGDFDRLFVPFHCVTSDVWAKHKVVLSKGSLADAVRMSMSFPMVFEPIAIDGVPMYDGGIYDNYPVDVMMDDFNPERIIGVNVGSTPPSPSSRNPMDQLDAMIMQPQDYPFPTDRGLNIRIDLDEFSLLDFPKAAEIYAIGYKRGLEMMDSIKATVKGIAPATDVAERRAAFKRATPEVRISKVNVTGGTPGENAYLESLFAPRHGEKTISLASATDSYYRAISTGRLQNLVPTPVYNPADSTFTLNYRAVVKENFGVGVGGYISSSTMSMLFFHGGYNSLGKNSVNACVNGWVGQSYLAAEGSATYWLNTSRPSALTLRAVASRHTFHETEKLFYEVHDPDFIRRSELFGQLRYTLGTSMRSRLDLQVGGAHLTDTYHGDLHDLFNSRDTGTQDLWQAALRWERNTLDNEYAPSEGSFYRVTGMGITGKYRYRGADPELRTSADERWLQLDMQATHYWQLSRRLSLGTEGRALLSTRKLLPTYQASVVAAEAIHPTPSSYNLFCRSLRANSFFSATLQPVVKVSDSFQLRGVVSGFLPMRKIEQNTTYYDAKYARCLHKPEKF
ncbi:MAG: patatin-like phospholipase family protein, partial [Duncaniella sp.]|nr:patatin-like phospholipase family protein [Duncaniella sp.]